MTNIVIPVFIVFAAISMISCAFTLFENKYLAVFISIILIYSSAIVPILKEFYDGPPTKQVQEAKEIKNCKMIEENIDTGFFQENTNKLNCDGVIKNIAVSEYDHLMSIAKSAPNP